MYWTDWGRRPNIKHATMDGYNPKPIVQDNLGWPNGLSVDFDSKKIFWADARLDRYVCMLLNLQRTESVLKLCSWSKD